jgi:gluconolactonase
MELANVRVVAEGLAFPEGPVAFKDGSVIVVEIAAGRVTRCLPDGRKITVAEVGGGPNGAALGPDGALYVCNNGFRGPVPPSIQRVDLATGKTEVVYADCDGARFTAPNDLVFDATGRFWFTDFMGDAIYYAAPDGGRIELVLSGVHAPNGVGLAPDGATLYWAQTYTRQVMLRRLSAPGRIIPAAIYSNASVIRRLAVDPTTLLAGLPGARELDSLAVDSTGAVCVGTLIDSGISVISADGSSVELLTLPPALADAAVTNICFGGPDLRTAFITCSMTGRLVACDWPHPGLRLAYGPA